MASLHCSELSSRRASIQVQAKTRVAVVRASDYGDAAFVDFLIEQARNPFMAHRVYSELQGLINEGRRFDDTLFQIYKLARATSSKVENMRFVESFA